MTNIELVVNDDVNKISHLFCGDCATELNIVLDDRKVYLNPRWTVDWDTQWHEFHYVRFIYTELLFDLLGEHDELRQLTCPNCSCKGKIIIMDNGLFDVRLIRKSLDDDASEYKCIRCEKVYASQECVTRIGRDYICGDCAALA